MKVNEEKDIGPHVMFKPNVVVKSLEKKDINARMSLEKCH